MELLNDENIDDCIKQCIRNQIALSNGIYYKSYEDMLTNNKGEKHCLVIEKIYYAKTKFKIQITIYRLIEGKYKKTLSM